MLNSKKPQLSLFELQFHKGLQTWPHLSQFSWVQQEAQPWHQRAPALHFPDFKARLQILKALELPSEIVTIFFLILAKYNIFPSIILRNSWSFLVETYKKENQSEADMEGFNLHHWNPAKSFVIESIK